MQWLAQMYSNLYLPSSVFRQILKHVQSSFEAAISKEECQKRFW